MPRIGIILVLCVLQAAPTEPAGERRRAEIVNKADQVFGERYSPPADTRIKLFDKEAQWAPPDSVTYRYNSNYVAKLIFTADGALVRLSVAPEASLREGFYFTTGQGFELLRTDMHSIIQRANLLRPLGKPLITHEPPDACFQSGVNLYCGDFYEFASVSHFWREESLGPNETVKPSLKVVEVCYKQEVVGTVSDIRDNDKQPALELKIAAQWYRIQKNQNDESFPSTNKDSVVTLTTCGCAGSEKVCSARWKKGQP